MVRVDSRHPPVRWFCSRRSRRSRSEVTSWRSCAISSLLPEPIPLEPDKLPPGALPLVLPVAVPLGVALPYAEEGLGDEVDEIEPAFAPLVAPPELMRRSSALTRSVAAAISWRKRASSLPTSAPGAVPPLNVPLPETVLLPALGTELVLAALPLPVLVTVGVSAPVGALALAGDDDTPVAPDAAGGLPTTVDADGTLGSPVVAVDGVVFEGVVVTGLAGVSTRVSLLHAATEAPIAAAINNLRVTIVCSCDRYGRLWQRTACNARLCLLRMEAAAMSVPDHNVVTTSVRQLCADEVGGLL